MRRARAAVVAAALAGGVAVVAAPPPAGAGVGASSSGTQILVLVSGDASVSFSCVGGNAAVNGAAVSPALACSAVTKAVVAGDGGRQTVDGHGLDGTAFSSHPSLTASLGAGNDVVADTKQADTLTMGDGSDKVQLRADSVADTSIDMGTDASGTEVDTVEVDGLSSADTMHASTSGSTQTITVSNSAGFHTRTATNGEFIWLVGNGGNDTLTTTPIPAASSVTQLRMDGGDGNDTLIGGPHGAVFFGEDGANTLTGGTGTDTFYTQSDQDSIQPGGGSDFINDTLSLRSGGRTIATSAGSQQWGVQLPRGDAVSRIHPGTTAGTALVTDSLDRTGQQALGSSVNSIGVDLHNPSATNPHDRGLADVVAIPGKAVTAEGGSEPGNLADVTIPTGGWATSGDASSALTVTSDYGLVTIRHMGPTMVHGRWQSANLSFAHRVMRDLLFRFATDTERNLMAQQLDAGARTRPQAIATIMDTDVYRVLDVDRDFLRFLGRASDPSGRVYWVSSLANGKSLRQFRAQLLGSNEYFVKHGSTNAGYMEAAYADVFGRAPDPAGEAYWVHKLDSGVERGIVARSFLASTEARRTIVKDQFLRFVDRYPNTTETDTWVANLAGPTGEQDLIAYLAASTAYYTRS